jgi:hypothetical protein
MAPISIQNRADLPRGVGKGYPKINRNMKKKKRKANANTKMRKTNICFMCGDFLKKQMRAQRLGVYRCSLEKEKRKGCIKQNTKKRNENRHLANLH